MTITINDVRRLCSNNDIRWTNHALVRILQRRITQTGVKEALISGEIIEQYNDDYPYPSCLVLGHQSQSNQLHVVCGIGEDKLWIITAYRPESDIWDAALKHRRDT